MSMLRRFLIVLVIALAALPVYARGSREQTEAPPEPESQPESQADADAEPAAEPEPEAAPGESSEDDSGEVADGEETTVEETTKEEPELVPMDDATAQVLFSMGMSPFQNKIPYEDFSLDLLGGGRMELNQSDGKFIFLNFWATWCPPCRAEMPSMQVLYDELVEEGFEMLAVNALEDRNTVGAFIEETGYTYPVLLDLQGRVSMRYAVRAYPTTYLIDRAGRVIGVRSGYHEWDSPEMIEAFRTLMAM